MKLAVLDLETDPFEHNRMIYPFVAGFYDGETFTSFWAKDCVARLTAYILKQPEPLCIFAHNGGRFDFFYFIEAFTGDMRIVNNRVIQAWIGPHELRDSFAIMPFPLAAYKKTPIDYQLMHAKNRDTNKQQIISYLKDDCVDLYTLCAAFIKEFGNSLTIGGASMKQLRKFHSFERGNGTYDKRLRSDYYFGGRNQVFQSGIINKPVKVYDVNSMYPYVMSHYLHPISTGLYRRKKIGPQTSFVTVEGKNYGAFPVRQKDGSLDFTTPGGVYHTTIHEFNAALDTGTFKPDRIHGVIDFSKSICFDEFVSHFYDARAAAKETGDKIRTIFYKFVLNSAYGKFAQNPENYFDWFIARVGHLPREWHECSKACDPACNRRWSIAFRAEQDYLIWKRPLLEHHFFNVATGASITGASRAVLLQGLRRAVEPYYCDTDSILCKSLSGIVTSETALGGWKLEASGDKLAICGKKLYAIFNTKTGVPDHVCIFDGPAKCMEPCPFKWCIKKAHKGAILTGQDILDIASGAIIESRNPVPAFKWNGTYSFTKRNIRFTGTGKSARIGV